MNKKNPPSKDKVEKVLNKAFKQYLDTLSTLLSPENKKRARESLKKSLENAKNRLDWIDPKILESLEQEEE